MTVPTQSDLFGFWKKLHSVVASTEVDELLPALSQVTPTRDLFLNQHNLLCGEPMLNVRSISYNLNFLVVSGPPSSNISAARISG